MRLKNIKNATDIVANSKYVVKKEDLINTAIGTFFDNENPINLEIGTGKGDFIIQMAMNNPHINFIGIEKYASVLVSATKKLEAINIKNLKLICMDASNINEIFKSVINTLYLNFSDPWPKNRHAKRRLTSTCFLKKYTLIFKGEPHICQKTDNLDLFCFSLEEYVKEGYCFMDLSFNYHQTHKDIVKTEYERKFSELGFKINYVEAKKNVN